MVLVLEAVVSLHRTGKLHLFWHQKSLSWGIDLDYCDIEWFALEMNRDHSVVLDIAPKYSIWTLLLAVRATPFLVRDSCKQ